MWQLPRTFKTREKSELQKKKKLNSGLITLVSVRMHYAYSFWDHLERFHEQYPHVCLRITNHTTPEALESLRNDLCDFSVVTTPQILPHLLQVSVLSHFEDIYFGKKYKELIKTSFFR